MSAWSTVREMARKMRSISPAKSVTKLPRTVKLAGVLAALLSVGGYVPIAIALKGVHTHGGSHPATPAHAAIVGGKPAQPGAFAAVAYIVDLRGNEVGQCTGTVVAPKLILTAGHCAENVKNGLVNKSSGYRVLTGSLDLGTTEPQVSTVLGVLVYEGYARRVDDGDAALLVLSTPTTAPAIALASASNQGDLQAGTPAMVVGWGITHYAQRRSPESLQWAPTAVQGRQWCKRNAWPFYVRSEICTIDPPSYATGACEGDSGGPLLVTGPAGEPVQIGITIHGYGKCSTHHPSVFTRVDLVTSWVHTWIEAYKPPPSPPPASPSPPAS
jgi:secreted trypsin-like serine protease